MRFATISLLLAALAEGARTKVTPITKVLTMLTNMKGTSEKQIHEEQVNFSAFKQWCEDTASEKNVRISEAQLTITELTANIGKFESDAEVLSKEIAGHEADVATWHNDVKSAVELREKQHADFVITHKDYSESIDALERAINEVKKQNFNHAQANSFLQKLATTIPIGSTDIESFLADGPSGLNYTAPDAYGYEFQSVGVIEMLEKLLDKFEDERNVIEKEEANQQSSHELIKQSLVSQIAHGNQAIQTKHTEMAQKAQAAAQAKGDLQETHNTLASDSKYVSDLTSECQTKHEEFSARQKLRAEEIEALGKALEILNGHITPNVDKHLPGGVSLIQAGSSSKIRNVQRKLASFLRSKADKIHSRILSALAVKVEDDAFVKVKKMIEDLIFRLMEEANQQAQHKGWCDKELTGNDHVKKEKASEVATLTSEIEELEAKINKLSQDISDLQVSLADLDKAVSTATEQRHAEKTVNLSTVKDATEAQAALTQAIIILKDYYSKAGAPALIAAKQTPRADAPITWDSAYTGQLGSKGVIDMLEVIQSDFARLESETRADEEAAASAYDKFINESAINKVTMQKRQSVSSS